MVKLIILILFIILLTSLFWNKENFITNPNKHLREFLKIQKHFRQDCKRGFYSCIKSNPYKTVYPFNKHIRDKKYVNYKNTGLTSNLLPMEVNK